MYSEDNFLMLSALQHFLFCKRQCALIHIEQQWQENVFTVKGQNMHEKADTEKVQKNKNLRIEYGLRIRSFELGLIGKADVVEFHKKDNVWLPFPVEYKLGKPKFDDCDRVQLCAQAICLEETLERTIDNGAIFYGRIRRRENIIFDDDLRNLTKETAIKFHAFFEAGNTPVSEYDSKKCFACSLNQICLPKLGRIKINNYMDGVFHEKDA